ncbi:TPA: hypothetical protein SAN82_002514 [Pseudomonas putida]|nr:hypothetical protein [Pseudomonas putida]
MKSLRSVVHAVAFVPFLANVSFAVHAAEVPLNSDARIENFETRVLAVDPAKYQVTIEGLDKRPVSIQLSDQAKALRNLKVGDKVDIRVTRSIDHVLDTSVEGAPGVTNDAWINRAADGSAPGGEVYRTVKVTSKITHIDSSKHEVTLLSPDGKEQVVIVNDPKVQARLKDLEPGQTVDAIFTEVLKVETSR